jgi:hypothetical protein
MSAVGGRPGDGHDRRARRAVDGKAVQGTRHGGDSRCTRWPPSISRATTVLGQARVDGKTSEITRFAPQPEFLELVGRVITADAITRSASTRSSSSPRARVGSD